MLLRDRLNQRIAEAIKHQIDSRTRCNRTPTSAAWRARCEVAQVAMFSDAERSVFHPPHHRTARQCDAARELCNLRPATLRTTAIFFLARKPS